MPSLKATRTIVLVALMVVPLIALLRTVSAQGCPEIVGRWPYGKATRVVAEGDLAFAVVGSTLTVFDVADPSDPTPIGELLLPKTGMRIAVSGSRVYLARRELLIVDVSQPAEPVMIGRFDFDDYVGGIAIARDHAFVTVRSQGVQVIDVGDPSSPTLAGSIDLPGSNLAISVEGSVAIVVQSGIPFNGRVTVLDVTDPTTPAEAGHVDNSNFFFFFGVALSGTHAYVSDERGLNIINVGDPASPFVEGYLNTSSALIHVAASGNLVFVNWDFSELRVIDVSDPANPVLVGALPITDIQSLSTNGGLVFLADGEIQIIDVHDPSLPEVIGRFSPPDDPVDVVVSGDFAYAAAGSEMRVWDVLDPASPISIANLDLPASSLGIDVVENTAFLSDFQDGLRVVDIGDPTAPVEIGHLDISGYGFGRLAVADGFAYIVDDHGLVMVDVSDPTTPTSPLRAPAYFYGEDLAVSGDAVYVAAGQDGLFIFQNVGPGAYLDLVGSLATTGTIEAVAVAGHHVYVTDFGDFRVIDASDPANPVWVGRLDNDETFKSVAVSGNTAYVALWEGVAVIDVSDPTTPVLLDRFETPGVPTVAFVKHAHLFVADGPGGLTIARVCQLFADGFESGDLAAWSVAVH